MVKAQEPRRTSTKDVVEKREKKDKPEYIKEHRPQSYNVMEILAQYYPQRGEDYAIQLFYRSKQNRHNPFFTCTEKRMDDRKSDEIAYLTISGHKYVVNIRSGEIFSAD